MFETHEDFPLISIDASKYFALFACDTVSLFSWYELNGRDVSKTQLLGPTEGKREKKPRKPT